MNRRAHDRAVRQAYPHAVELVVLAVRAGHLPVAAVQASLPLLPDPVRDAFAEVADRTGRGERFADALSSLPRHLGPIAGPLADHLAAADRYGLPLAPVLDRLAAEARDERRRQIEARTRELPVRLAFPLVVCTLPGFALTTVVPLLLAAISSLRS